MTEDTLEIIRKMYGEVSAMRTDLTTLMKTVSDNQTQAVSDRQSLHRDMGALRERLVAVETRLSGIELQWNSSAGDRRKVATWLGAGGVALTIATGAAVAWIGGLFK